jgi:hypothetical protein
LGGWEASAFFARICTSASAKVDSKSNKRRAVPRLHDRVAQHESVLVESFRNLISVLIGVADELPVHYRGGVGKSNRGLGGRGWELEKLRSNENL